MRYEYTEYTHNFFSVIDTQEKAYILGLLYADGCVHTNHNRIELVLKDRKILERVKDEMGLNNPIKERDFSYTYKDENKTSSMFVLYWASKKQKEDLIKLGCTPAKSLTLQEPKNIPTNLISHFIRGLFDGDGSWCFYSYTDKRDGRDYFKLKFMVVGSKDVLNYVAKQLPCKSYMYANGNIFRLVVRAKKDIVIIGDYLYKDKNLFLQRKFDIFKDMETHINTFKDKKCTQVIHKKTRKVYNSIKEASKDSKKSYDAVVLGLRNDYKSAEFEYLNKGQ